MDTLEYGGTRIDYEIRLLPARRTLSIEVHPDRRVVVRAPADCGREVIAARVRRRAAWIQRQLAEFERYQPRTPPRRYVSGESHWYLGRQYRLKVASADTPGVTLTRGEMRVGVAGTPRAEKVRAILQCWYRERARLHFSSEIESWLPRLGVPGPARLVVRTMRSRWGSLSAARTMTLNLGLIRAPRACIQYVIAHELCHLRHRKHDAAFYAHLEGVMPDWRKRKAQLELLLP